MNLFHPTLFTQTNLMIGDIIFQTIILIVVISIIFLIVKLITASKKKDHQLKEMQKRLDHLEAELHNR
ncbi:hypothetical protein [Halalkalibacillus halophilus]|uniref:hypothetical protein n=1 Tax=Halalkalibacillus halophilus TaxID=392827 RepID=UPI0004211876|nr:hypothetical protein [Halalkalibacillus halophilus]